MKRFLLVLILQGILCSRAAAVPAGGSYISFYGDIGHYFKGYKSYEYRDNPTVSFPVPMINAGSEIAIRKDSGYSCGGGISGVNISEGSENNWVYTERQERTGVFLPYLFFGNDFGLFLVELGISYYITSTGGLSRDYYKADGSEKEEGDHLFFMRRDSFVFMNMNIRIFKKDSIHFKLRLGRERFHLIESLLNTAVVIPFGGNIIELYLSYPTGFTRYLPESDQSFGISYTREFDPYFIGLNISYLLSNDHGGGGLEAFQFHDYRYYTVGFETGVKW